jgi:hypothetical protein
VPNSKKPKQPKQCKQCNQSKIKKRQPTSQPIKGKPCGCGKAKQNGNTDMDRRR